MNQLMPIVLIVGVAIVGMIFLMGTAANPTDAVTGKITGANKAVSLPLIVDGKQDVYLKATQYGTYSPSYLKVKKGIPVRIHYSADQGAGCGREVIFPSFNKQQLAPPTGEAIIEFTPTSTGSFPYYCPMRMFRGTIEVVQ